MNLSYFESKGLVKYNFPLSSVCTMKTGGNAKFVFSPENKEQLAEIIGFLRENKIKFKVMGNGSNIIFKDSGYSGAVVLTSNMKAIYEVTDDGFKKYKEDNGKEELNLYVTAGYSLTSLASRLSKSGYSGLEFAYGIPALIGGAVFMNAGAYGGEMKNIIQSVEYLNTDGSFSVLYNEQDEDYFGYRHSFFMDNPELIIVGTTLKLHKADGTDPMEIAENNMRSRKEKQPLEYPSCGSAFKRPEGHFAGALIEQAGLKGKNIGGAYVSEKHAGFIINKGGATTADVVNLIEYVKNKVYESSGVMLEPEIRVVED